MPEGHSVRRLANTFEQFFVGDVCRLSSPQGRFAEGAATLDGRVMAEAFSYGKHLFMRFSEDEDVALHGGAGASAPAAGDLWLHTHLGLYGAWRFQSAPGVPIEDSIGAPRVEDPAAEETGVRARVAPVDGAHPNEDGASTDEDGAHPDEDGAAIRAAAWQPEEPVGAVRVRIETEEEAGDLSGPTVCEVLDAAGVEEVLDRLGPDPLDSETDQDVLRKEFVRRVRASRRTVGDLVMDQSVSAGVGNIYRAEALFRQGISPMRKGANVAEKRLDRLWDDFVLLLNEGVDSGKIVTVRDEDKPENLDLDPEADRWYVYKRADHSCLVCGNPVKRADLMGRDVYWCTTCQR